MDTKRRVKWFVRWMTAGVSVAVLGTSGCLPTREPGSIIGVKLYLNQDGLQARYPDYDRLVEELRGTGVNALFTTLYEGRKAFYDSAILPERDPAIDLKKLRESARKQHVLFGAISQIFYDADTLALRPDLVPVDQHGDNTFVNWQKLVCPSEDGYRRYKLSIVKEIATTIRPDVISLDFMRFPTTWEIIPADAKPESIRNYCFCDRCLTRFQKEFAVAIPRALDTTAKKSAWIVSTHNADWVKWKTGLIASFVEEAAHEVHRIDPAIKISIHVLPWSEATFGNALVWNAGQDVAAMAANVDYLSPMIYHKLIGHPNDYIASLTAELARKTNKRILPSIQAAKILTEDEVSAGEFRQSLGYALQTPSSGTLIYHWGELRLDDSTSGLRREKNRILKAASQSARK